MEGQTERKKEVEGKSEGGVGGGSVHARGKQGCRTERKDETHGHKQVYIPGKATLG